MKKYTDGLTTAKKDIGCLAIFILIVISIILVLKSFGNCKCVRYASGRDTMLQIGNGRFEVTRGYSFDGDGRELRYTLWDNDGLRGVHAGDIEADVLAYYDDKEAKLCYLIAAHGYVVVDYKKFIMEKHESLTDFSEDIQEVFREKELFTAFPEKSIP